jgi:exosortase
MASVCAAAGLALFQFFGNATRGYIDTSSTVWWWIRQWLDPASETEHGWLILGISVWLLGRNLRRAKRGEGDAERVKGKEAEGQVGGGRRNFPAPLIFRLSSSADLVPVAAMVAALGLHALGFVAQQTRLSLLAVLLFTWGVLRLGGGRRWGDAAMFPLGFLVFALPLNVLDSLGFWLRLWVVDAAGVFASVAGIALTRSGTQLFSPDGGYHYDVAAACSGVRSLMALAALSLLIGYLSFRSGWRRALLLALCLPLTYLGNVVRIVAVIVAAQAGGQIWGERMHGVMGFGVFVIVLGGVLGAAKLVQRWRPEGGAESPELRAESTEAGVEGNESSAMEVQSDRAGIRFRIWVAAGAIVALAVGEMVLFSRVAALPARAASGVRLGADEVNPVELPAFLGTEWIGRRTEITAVEREVLPADTGFARRNYVNVQSAHAVFFSVVLSGRDRTSIHRPELCLIGQGWSIRDRSRRAFRWASAPGATVPATVLRTEQVTREGRTMPALTAYWFVSSEGAVATHWERLLRDAWSRVRHGRADRWAYVLMQTDALDGEVAALARMEAVFAGVWPEVAVNGAR